MKLASKKSTLSLAIALASGLAAQAAISATSLEEVVVTAQKREQSLQDTPIAISAFDSDAIENYSITDVADIGQLAPNMNIAESPGGGSSATIAIRGSVTSNPAISWEPTVGIYLDGVFLGKNMGGIFDIAELARVEVLRGPQGTLYGKNTLGGAINLITRKPGQEMGGKLRVTAGNYDLIETSLSFDTGAFGTVGEGLGQLTTNLAYMKTDRDGLYKNKSVDLTGGTGLVNPASTKDFKDLDNEVYRLDTILAVNEDLEIRYTYDYSKRDNTTTPAQLVNVSQAGFDALDTAYGFGGALSALAPILANYQTDGDKRKGTIGADAAGNEVSETDGHSLTISWDAGDWGFLGDVTLKSLTSLRTLDFEDLIDIDGTPMDYFHSGRDIDYEQTSQEFQLLGKTDNVDYVIGAYYFSEEADVFNPISFLPAAGFPTANNEYGFDNDSVALYGQAEWRPVERLALTAGIRWTKEEKDQYIFHPGVIPLSSADDSWKNTSGTLVAAWDLTDDINIYAKVAQGWKSGGFNAEASTLATFNDSYDPEEMLSMELGLKSRLLDNRLQVNVAAFQNKMEDMQFSVFLSGGAAASNIDNAGEATVQGLELETIAQLTDSLRMTVNYGYLDTEYDEFREAGVDVADSKDFQFSPQNTASVSFDYAIGSFSWGDLDAHIDWSYTDDQVPYTNASQNLHTALDSREVVNARITLSNVMIGQSNTLKVSAWGKNITDEEYRTHGIPFGLWDASYYGDPATYGLDVTYQF